MQNAYLRNKFVLKQLSKLYEIGFDSYSLLPKQCVHLPNRKPLCTVTNDWVQEFVEKLNTEERRRLMSMLKTIESEEAKAEFRGSTKVPFV